MIFRGPGDGYRAAYGSSDGLSYYAHSFVGEGGEPGTAEPLAPNLVKLYLELPRLDERVPSLAHQVIANQTGEEAQARALERYFRQQFGYTMELLAHEVPDPLAYFLFERRKGHCEYFASAMAVMLRSLGIPSRVVTGFQSGTYNPITGWYVVRASDAHSWVEAFIRGRGWLTFDPTPPDPSLATTTLWARVRLLLDAADTFWHEWVLNYDIERQLSLAEHMERSGRTFRMQWVDRLASSIAALKTKTEGAARRYGWVVLTGVLLAWLASRMAPRLWAWWTTRERLRRLHRGQVKAADATLLYTRALRALKRKGYEKPAWITPAEFARVLPMSPISLLVDDLTAAYNELRFGSKAEVAPRFIRLLEQLEKEVISGG
jgi:hypothetical protein